ncbi:MAG: hypothetical protein H0A75_06815 [Candidatus Methanofishera endochildressiae]|uniref:Uncharacterized protein n=1 Tax=Candidatus Methanofishera endochildressiae TaxID=2738884 RepID=A0A7Z0SFE9_9GAMM|nr:hypothetical protein [Candidatus Methanofishera endochildressiae]
MDNSNQHEEIIVFDNLIRSVAGDKTSLEAVSHTIEPFCATNGAGAFGSFENRDDVLSAASTAGNKVKGILATC